MKIIPFHERHDLLRHLQSCFRGLVGEVERFPAELVRYRRYLFSQEQVGTRSILYIDIVTSNQYVRPNLRCLSTNDRADRAGNQTTEVEIPTPKKVPKPGN